MANLVICRNPFRPQLDREVSPIRAGARIDTVLRAGSMITGRGKKIHRSRRFIVQVNGEYVLQDAWCRRIQSDDIVVVSLLPAGGGGGGSNPLQAVLTIAIIVASAYTGGAVGALYGATAGSLASAGVMLAGSMLINAVLPPPSSSAAAMMNRESGSPSYSISASGNNARLMEAIPVLYGRFRIYPDFAASPYTENSGNQQYLYQLFCVTQGELSIESVRIEDTPIGNFAEVQYEIIPPGGAVTLFPDNVVTSEAVQGLELQGENERPSDAPDNWTNVQGPFVASPAGSQANVIAVDIVLAQGLFYTNDNGSLSAATVSWSIMAQPIDDDGTAIGSAFQLAAESLSLATADPQVLTYRYNVAPGRYQISAVRTNSKNTDSRVSNTLSWTGLRAYLPSRVNYGNVTLIATIIRGTNNLNQNTARRLNVIGTRKLQTWDPVNGWSTATTATRSPAWAFADALRNTDYGRGLPDSKFNLPELYRLAGVWAARGDTFDGVFDTTTTIWEALTTIARVGRAMPMYYAGVVDIVRNEPRSIATAMFSPYNIAKNSLQITYKFPAYDSPDHVIVEYTSDVTWQPSQVTCVLPGGTTNRPATVQLIGCSNHDQAWREGISMAAANRDQIRFIQLDSEMEGNIPRYGDLVQISHDVPAWGLSGLITSYDQESGIYRTSEPLEWFAGETHVVAFRRRDGSADGPHEVIQGPDLNSFRLSGLVGNDIYISDGISEEYTHYQFGPVDRQGLAVQLLSCTPGDKGKVSLNFVNYADSVHSAENGGVVPPPNGGSLLPREDNAPIVDSVSVFSTAVTGQQVITVNPASGAKSYEFQASNDEGASWQELGVSAKPSLTVNLPAGPWWVRVRGIGVMAGPWKTLQTTILATMLPPPMLELMTATPQIQGIQIDWVFPAQAINVQSVELRYADSNSLAESGPPFRFAYPQSSFSLTGLGYGVTLFFWARIIDQAGVAGPWYPSSEAGLPGQSSSDATGILDAIAGQIGKEQLTQELSDQIDLIGNVEDLLTALPDAATVNQMIARQSSADGKQDALAALQLIGLNTNDATDARTRTALLAKFSDVQAQILEESHVRATANEALAEAISTVESTLGDTTASVEEVRQTVVNLDGSVSANWSVKTGATVDGKRYMAGLGAGVEETPEGMQTSVYALADRFAILNLANGQIISPFVIQNGVAIINQAVIGNATITAGKFVQWLESVALNAQGVPILRLNFQTGEIQLNGSASGGGRLTLTNQLLQVFDQNGVLRVRMGIW